MLAASVLGAPVELETRQSCSALQLVHVGGTADIGLGIVGTPLAAAMASLGYALDMDVYVSITERFGLTESRPSPSRTTLVLNMWSLSQQVLPPLKHTSDGNPLHAPTNALP
jgi:hypothetical protein